MGVNNLSYSAFGERLTEQGESERFLAYDDARPDYILQPGDKIIGTLTNGYGHTGRDVFIGQVSTHQQNVNWLLADAIRSEMIVNTYVDVPLTQYEFDGLVDFVLNIGGENFKNSTVLKCLNAGDKAGAAKHLEDWVYSKGKKLAGLLNRRLMEEAMFNGKDQQTTA